MKINAVYTQGHYNALHQAIYSPLDADRYIRRCLANPSDQNVELRTDNPYMRKLANRVALIMSRHQNFLRALEARDDLDEEIRDKLPALKRCLPAGVSFTEEFPALYCRLYAGCPWCRFRKALEIITKLDALRSRAQQLAFITIAIPFDLVPFASDSFEEDHRELIRIICKKKRLFFADHVVTVPNWRATHEIVSDEGRSKTWAFNLETTIIGLMEDRGALPLPEDCLSSKRRCRMVSGGVGSGTWSVGRPTQAMLTYALRRAMGYSPALFSEKLSQQDYRIVLNTQSIFRAVGHGAAG